MSLINKLPSFYHNDIVSDIQNSLTVEVDLINSNLEELLNQFFVESATNGLDKWEAMLGITKNNFNILTRRENIKAKMRSKGTTTFTMIKKLCQSYSNGVVDINVDHTNYSFEIEFVSTIGIPLNFEELDRTINEIKPCHLAHTYKFNYNTHTDISKYTHEALQSYPHEEIRNSSELRGGR